MTTATTNLPTASTIDAGARFRVDSRMRGAPAFGVYLTRTDADTIATAYRGTVVEVGDDGIALAYWSTPAGIRKRAIDAKFARFGTCMVNDDGTDFDAAN